jgi:TetR/AcrR family transcriptional regulator, lmrAB and yxaGH operons repressor
MVIDIFQERNVKGQITRTKYIETASALFQVRGYHGTGLAEIIEASGAPKGSFYFHFKGGKEELAIATINLSHQQVLDLLGNAFDHSKSPGEYIDRIGKALMQWLKSTDFAEGCAVASMTLEAANSSEQIALACRDCYRDWIGRIGDHLNALSPSTLDHASSACVIMSALEGAVIRCRCERSVMPLKRMLTFLSATQT